MQQPRNLARILDEQFRAIKFLMRDRGAPARPISADFRATTTARYAWTGTYC
jgi:hypothetical protein